MFRVKAIEFENAFVFNGSYRINFPERGLVLIEGMNEDAGGSNGAGKTSFLNLIPTALFEQNGSGLIKDLVINRFCESCEIRLVLDNGLLVVYTRSRRGKSDWFLVKDGKQVRGKSLSETKNLIFDALRVTYEQYSSVVHLRQGGTLGFWELSPSERVKMISDILGLGRYEVASQRAREFVNDLDKGVAGLRAELSTLEGVMNKLKDELSTRRALLIDTSVHVEEGRRLSELVKSKSEELKDWLKELGSLELKMKTLKDEQRRIGMEIADKERLKEERARNMHRIESLLKDIVKMEEERRLLSERVKMKDELSAELFKLRTLLERRKDECSRKEGKIIELRKILELRVSDDCPVCGRPIDSRTFDQRRKHIEGEILGLEKEVDLMKREIDELKMRISGVERELASLHGVEGRLMAIEQVISASKKEELERGLSFEKEQIGLLERDIMDLKGKLVALGSEQDLNERFWEVKRRVVALEQEIGSLNKEIERINRVIMEQESVRKRIAEIEDELRRLEAEIRKKQDLVFEEERKILYYKWWVDGFKRFQLIEISNAIELLQERLQFYAGSLFEDRMVIELDVFAQKKTKKEELDFKHEINMRINDGLIPLSGYSGGEKQLLSLVLMLSLNDILGFRFLILDEVFGSLDELNRERVIRLLREVSKEKLVLVVTHIDDVKTALEWDRILRVIRRNGSSRLEEVVL
jgi:DNA repair exonuclease SbcCD ATPase subunit